MILYLTDTLCQSQVIGTSTFLSDFFNILPLKDLWRFNSGAAIFPPLIGLETP
jgi:hypothetical protein